jgi:hypothetical protein
MYFIIGSSITLLVVILTGFLWFINFIFVKMPQQQMMMIEKFSIMAVKRTEQLHPIFEENQKYYDAVENIKEIFEEFGIVMPGDIAVDTAVRSAIYTVWKDQELLGLSRLKTELDEKAEAMEITQNLKAVKMQDTDSLDRIIGALK